MRSFAVGLFAFALLLSFPGTSAQDAEDPTAPVYTVVVDEPSEVPPPPSDFYDLLEIAVAEPGDGTFVLRGTLAGEPGADVGVLYFGFTTPAGDIVGGCTYGGAPSTRNIGEPIAPDACVLSGTVFFATYSYESAETAIGSSITQIWGFTDMCPAACFPGDTAPGGDGSVGPNGWNAGVYGLDYVLTGCSRPTGCGGSTGPVLETLNGTTVAIGRSFANATSDVDTYSWSTNLTAVQVSINATVVGGSANLTIVDGANTTVLQQTIEANATLEIPIPTAAAGNWSIQVNYTQFAGNITLGIGPLLAAPLDSEPLPEVTPYNDDTATGGFPLRPSEETPATGLPFLLLALTAVLALAVRRRLA